MIRDDSYIRKIKDAAVEDLKRYRQARRDIKHLRELIDRQRSKVERTSKPPSQDKVRVQQENPGPEPLLIAIADLETIYGTRLIEAERLCMEIEGRISYSTSGIHARILRGCYLYNQTYKMLAAAESYSVRQIMRYHWQAVEMYGERLQLQKDGT